MNPVAAASIPIRVTASDWGAVLPELIMGGAVLVLLLADAFLPDLIRSGRLSFLGELGGHREANPADGQTGTVSLDADATEAGTAGDRLRELAQAPEAGVGGHPQGAAPTGLTGVRRVQEAKLLIWITSGIALLALAAAFASSAYLWNHGSNAAFYATVTSDRFAMFFNFVILLTAALVVLLSASYIENSTFDPGEYFALLLASATGMMLMAAATSFMLIFLAVELLSLALYILAGFERSRPRSQEAGFKYFLLSSFASAFLVYGIALIYGATGSTQLQTINFCLHHLGCSGNPSGSPLLFVGIGLLVVGFAFKVSLVPFHMWTPDVYEGAPTPVTAFMSVTTKAAVFAAFVRVFNFALSAAESHWYGLIAALAVTTMIVGNALALVQTNMKRLLAYSGIAHAGYILVAIAANNADGVAAVAFYFLVYAFMNTGAFILVSVLESSGQVGDDIGSYRGLFNRNPSLAIGTAVFMFSLAGFPPTGGFFAKYLAFAAVVRSGHTELAIVGVLTSLVSIFYYLRVVVLMFLEKETEPRKAAIVPVGADVAMAATVACSIGFGIIPTGFFNLASQSVDAIRAAFGVP